MVFGNVIHLHGSINEERSSIDPNIVYILDEEEMYDINRKFKEDGSIMRPNIVFFGENIQNFDYCKGFLAEADIFIIIETSLTVFPAVDLIMYASKKSSKYMIDKNIPQKNKIKYPNFCFIEEKATKGALLMQKKFLNK